MQKYISDWTITENTRLSADFCLLKVGLDKDLPEIIPGQFVQILVPNAPQTFLRRPISVHFVDYAKRKLWLLVQRVGEGTRKLSELQVGEQLNIVYPLGNGFTLPNHPSPALPEGEGALRYFDRGGMSDNRMLNAQQKELARLPLPLEGAGGRLLLVGGGAGTAPLLYLGKQLKDLGYSPIFLLGGRTINHLLQLEEFEKQGEVHTTTEDGSHGEKGFVTNHSVMSTGTPTACSGDISSKFSQIYVCGPKPMMMAVAKYAKQNDIPCEVSLENKMACGIGACLCCVEKTTFGNACVCTAGPVFNINQLSSWQI
jgi:dihydroorotate dehydrogenase electron transfer subunit